MSERAMLELIRGKGAHADLVACVEDLSLDLAWKKIPGFPHSIWQILGHINYWIDYELKRIAGERPRYPDHADESWPSGVGPMNEEEWRAEKGRFAGLLEKLTALANSLPELLDVQVETLHASQSSRSSTVRAVLWQIVAHNSYHIGQIVMLRQCLGAWPTREGGDTW
jgi:uncharacterized damage-inducible protein DinB